jgi:hypothetical protein
MINRNAMRAFVYVFCYVVGHRQPFLWPRKWRQLLRKVTEKRKQKRALYTSVGRAFALANRRSRVRLPSWLSKLFSLPGVDTLRDPLRPHNDPTTTPQRPHNDPTTTHNDPLRPHNDPQRPTTTPRRPTTIPKLPSAAILHDNKQYKLLFVDTPRILLLLSFRS